MPDVHLEILFDQDGASGLCVSIDSSSDGVHLLVDVVDRVGDLVLVDGDVIHCLAN